MSYLIRYSVPKSAIGFGLMSHLMSIPCSESFATFNKNFTDTQRTMP